MAIVEGAHERAYDAGRDANLDGDGACDAARQVQPLAAAAGTVTVDVIWKPSLR
jgi:hypothetical protein